MMNYSKNMELFGDFLLYSWSMVFLFTFKNFFKATTLNALIPIYFTLWCFFLGFFYQKPVTTQNCLIMLCLISINTYLQYFNVYVFLLGFFAGQHLSLKLQNRYK